MLFDSSVRRELWRSFSGTLVVLLTVVLTMLLIRILSQATRGAFAPADLSLVLSYTLIGQLPVMVALAWFVLRQWLLPARDPDYDRALAEGEADTEH